MNDGPEMRNMNISFPPELVSLIQQKVDSGSFPNPAEVVREGLRLIQEQEEQQQKLEELRQELAVGLEELRKGNSRPVSAQATLDRLVPEGFHDPRFTQ